MPFTAQNECNRTVDSMLFRAEKKSSIVEQSTQNSGNFEEEEEGPDDGELILNTEAVQECAKKAVASAKAVLEKDKRKKGKKLATEESQQLDLEYD